MYRLLCKSLHVLHFLQPQPAENCVMLICGLTRGIYFVNTALERSFITFALQFQENGYLHLKLWTNLPYHGLLAFQFLEDISPFAGWCIGHLVTSALHIIARAAPLTCVLGGMNPPLVQHVLTSWQPGWHPIHYPVTFSSISRRPGIGVYSKH